MRALVDTNILIDYFGRRMPHFKLWEKLSAMQVFGDVELWVAPQSFADAFYVLQKQIDPHELQQAFCKSLSFLNVCSVGTKEVFEASRRSWNDYEDCLVALCAENIDADVLLSRDTNGFRDAKTSVYTLEGFFTMVEDEYSLVYESFED